MIRPRAFLHGMLISGLLCMVSTGCHRKLNDLVEEGRYEQAVTEARQGRMRPEDGAARSYARALVETGRFEQARAVLLEDFRHGGHLRSLLALARLEQSAGLDGTAALHYGRLMVLDREFLIGDDAASACDLFRRRARAFVALGEAGAAREDLQRVELLCDPQVIGPARTAEDAALAERVAEMVKRQRRRRRRPIAAARRIPPAPSEDATGLRRWSQRHRVSLKPRWIARLLEAEIAGEYETELITVDELRRWVGTASWDQIRPAVEALPRLEAAYARMRLAAVVDIPIQGDPMLQGGGRPEAARLTHLIAAAEIDSGVRARTWRAFVVAGDLGAAELTLTTALQAKMDAEEEASEDRQTLERPDSPPRAAGDPPASTQPTTSADSTTSGESRPAGGGDATVASPSVASPGSAGPAQGHWALQLKLDPATVEQVVILARFRQLAGQHDLALALALSTLHRGRAAGVPVAEIGGEEARRHLAMGRPWHALALADSIPGVEARAVMAAASSAIVLCHAAGDARCGGGDDRSVVMRVLGEAWVARRWKEVRSQARQGVDTAESAGPCPTLAELTVGDAVGPLPEALRRAQQELGAGDTGRALQHAVESDPALICAGRIVTPLLRAGAHRLHAARLADLWAHAPQMHAVGQLMLHAELSMIAEQRRRPLLLWQDAAALAAKPRTVWLRASEVAQSTGALDLQVAALREVLMLSEGYRDPEVRCRLLLAGLQRLRGSWTLESTEDGTETVQRQVREYLQSGPQTRRWWRTEALARALATAPWMDARLRAVIEPVLWSSDAVRARHPWAWWLWSGGERTITRLDPLDLAQVESAAATGRLQALPEVTAAFAPLSQVDGPRLAFARAPRQGRRWAVAVATHGSARARRTAVALLLQWLDRAGAQRRAVGDWVVQRPAALAPAATGAVPMVHQRADLVNIEAGLPLVMSAPE